MKIFILYFDKSYYNRRSKFIMERISKYYEVYFFQMYVINYSLFKRIILEIKTTLKILFDREVKIVHLNDMSLILPFFIKILKLKRKILIYDIGNIHYETVKISGKSKIIVSLIKFLEYKLIKNADYVISRGIFLKQILEEIRGESQNIFYIPDPVNVNSFSESNNKNLNELIKKDEYRLLIGYTANFVLIKVGKKLLPRGWEIIEILNRFKEEGINDVKAIFIGTGDAIDNLKNLAYERKVDSMCFFTSYLPEKEFIRYLNSIDVGFMEDYDNIQYKTSIGIKVQQYMAAGKIVITGNGPERDFLLSPSQGKNLFFKPPKINNDEDILKYIEDLWNIFYYVYKNYDEIKALGLNNKKRALELFDDEVVSDSLLNLYNKINSELKLE